MQFVGSGGFAPFGDILRKFTDWYHGPSTSSNDYFLHQFVKGIPIIGGVLDAGDNERRMVDYLGNRGLSWGDIRYNGTPFGRSLGQATAGATTSVLNLYRNTYKDMMKGRESARKELFNQYYKRQMLKHRQVQTDWYRNHMRRY